MDVVTTVSNCGDCPQSYWRDANSNDSTGSTHCHLSDDVIIPLYDKAHLFVHKNCPLRQSDYIEITRLDKLA